MWKNSVFSLIIFVILTNSSSNSQILVNYDINKETVKEYSLHNFDYNYFLSYVKGVNYLKYENLMLYNFLGFEQLNYQSDVLAKNVKTFSYDPNNSNILYLIGEDNGLRKSLDRGRNWLNIKNNIPDNIRLISISVSSIISEKIYLKTSEGLFITRNAGFSWQKIKFSQPIDDIIIDSKQDGGIFIRSKNIVFYSSNDGSTWDKYFEFNLSSNERRNIEQIHLINDVEKFFLIRSFDKLYRYDPNSKSLLNVSPVDNTGSTLRATCLYADKHSIILGTFNGIFISSDRGLSWIFHKVKNLDKENWIIGVGKNPLGNGLLLINQDGEIFNLFNSGFIKGLNYGLVLNSNLLDLEICETQNQVILNSIILNSDPLYKYGYGVWNSTDYGKTWSPSFSFDHIPESGYPREWSPKFFRSPIEKNHLTMIEFNQIYESNDGGYSWSRSNLTNFKYANDNILKRVFDPIEKNISYFLAGVNEIGLFRYDKNSNSSMYLNQDVGYHRGDMIISANNNKHLLTKYFNLSTDGGWSWENKSIRSDYLKSFNKDAYARGVVDLHYFKEDIAVVSFTPDDPDWLSHEDYRLIRTDDFLKSWRVICELKNETFSKIYFTYVKSDDPNFFIIAYLDKKSSKGKIIIRPGIEGALQVQNLPVTGVNFIKYSSDRIYLGTKYGGLYISNDFGKSWQNLSSIKNLKQTKINAQNSSKPNTKEIIISSMLNQFQGTWKGSYTCGQGGTGLTLELSALANGKLSATFLFYPQPSNPDVKSGSFSMEGNYDSNGNFTLNAKEWINRPANYIMVDMSGKLDLNNNRLIGNITHQSCYSFELSKVD